MSKNRVQTFKEKPADPCVVVVVRGGLGEVVQKPAGVRVILADYDIDAIEEDRLEKDPVGDPCFIAERHAANAAFAYGPNGKLWPGSTSLDATAQAWYCEECKIYILARCKRRRKTAAGGRRGYDRRWKP